MFFEMYLIVNEVEKMVVGEKIKFCQILVIEQGGKRAGIWGGIDRLAFYIVSILLLVYRFGLEFVVKLKLRLVFCLDFKIIYKLGSLDKVFVRVKVVGIWG